MYSTYISSSALTRRISCSVYSVELSSSSFVETLIDT